MMLDTLPSLQNGRQVLSNTPIFLNGDPHPLYTPLNSYRDLLDAEHCDVLLDEIASIASSRESTALPAPVVNVLQQLRKRDVIVRWTAPAYARADKVLRETSQAVTICRAYAAKWDEASQWPQRRLFWLRTYDAADFVNFGLRPQDATIRPIARQWIWRPGHPVDGVYDSLAPVSYMGIVADSGSCVSCGGTRRRPKCECPPATTVGVVGDELVSHGVAAPIEL